MRNKLSWLLVVAGLALAGKQAVTVWQLWRSGDQVNTTSQQLQQAREQNQQLKQRLAEVDTPEFVEKEARDKLGYGREGEVILMLPQPQGINVSPKTQSGDTKPNWRKWWDLYIRI